MCRKDTVSLLSIKNVYPESDWEDKTRQTQEEENSDIQFSKISRQLKAEELLRLKREKRNMTTQGNG